MRTGVAHLLALSLVLLLGCGSTGYRVVRSDHDVHLGTALALSPVTHGASSSGDQAGFDQSLARALDAATPDHRVETALEAPYAIQVEVRELRREGARTITSTAVSILAGEGPAVDELEVAFEVAGDEAAAGAELGRRIGYFLTHREGHQI